ncbi:MAG TPA: leucyl aminopeptidase [Geminicoccus sp.]|jgi:leucyl aminopeptidase|uniref:leucyl aminopeptidase n=1 Tax=Geminicoccus sp. TaxID=2024832 RepID=UPI002E306E62|nr:leucyl aminopeptidase [Geminicoccus sp.]HEX2527487.1 leucyl aminopeptidase [Geminicoccus sp.]
MDVILERAKLPPTGKVVVPVGVAGDIGKAAAELDARTQGLVRRVLDDAGHRWKHGSMLELPFPAHSGLDRVWLVGLGKDDLSRLELEQLGGSLWNALVKVNGGLVTLASPDGIDLPLHPDLVQVALVTGLRLRSWRFDKYKKAEEDEQQRGPERLTVAVIEPGKAEPILADANAVVQGVESTRALVTEPANVLYPESFADEAKKLADLGLEVEVLDEEAIRELNMGAILGVAQGSRRAPRVVVIRWNGAGGNSDPLAFVGKGVCFDTGGISIKPAAGMEDMKFDMAGAGAVFGAMEALARRKAKIDVVGVLGLVENMPDGNAQRPGDVVRAMSGTTIEVINTDAEGRLVLADALWYTQNRFRPKLMIDLATLTGAVIVALGHEHAGLFCNNDELAARLTRVGEEVGETLWRMPLGKAYAKHIKSDIADIKNTGRARQAGSTAGAVFLEHFVAGLPWAHLDVAGTVWSSRDLPLSAKGATGYGVRLLDALARSYEDEAS